MRLLELSSIKSPRAYCYKIKIKDNLNECIKVGFTADFDARIKSFPSGFKIEIIEVVEGSIKEMWRLEQIIHDRFKYYRYDWQGPKFSGFSETYQINTKINLQKLQDYEQRTNSGKRRM